MAYSTWYSRARTEDGRAGVSRLAMLKTAGGRQRRLSEAERSLLPFWPTNQWQVLARDRLRRLAFRTAVVGTRAERKPRCDTVDATYL
jgi:hypothetical protein